MIIFLSKINCSNHEISFSVTDVINEIIYGHTNNIVVIDKSSGVFWCKTREKKETISQACVRVNFLFQRKRVM